MVRLDSSAPRSCSVAPLAVLPFSYSATVVDEKSGRKCMYQVPRNTKPATSPCSLGIDGGGTRKHTISLPPRGWGNVELTTSSQKCSLQAISPSYYLRSPLYLQSKARAVVRGLCWQCRMSMGVGDVKETSSSTEINDKPMVKCRLKHSRYRYNSITTLC